MTRFCLCGEKLVDDCIGVELDELLTRSDDLDVYDGRPWVATNLHLDV